MSGQPALKFLRLLGRKRHRRAVGGDAVPDLLDKRQALLNAEAINAQCL